MHQTIENTYIQIIIILYFIYSSQLFFWVEKLNILGNVVFQNNQWSAKTIEEDRFRFLNYLIDI